MTCGSNEFGQLGLFSESGGGKEGAKAGSELQLTLTAIDKKYLSNIVYIAAGRFHSIAIRKQSEADKNKEDDGEEEDDENK